MNSRDRQKEETRREILRKAEELFTLQGYEQTSLQNIASECGLTKGAFYHHFDSKEALLEEVCRLHHEFLLAAAEPHLERKDVHWFARIALILGAIRAANESRKALAGEYMKARRLTGGQLAQRLARYEKELYLKIIAPILSEARDQNEASFAGSAEMVAIFVHSLDRAMTDELDHALTLADNPDTSDFANRAREILETFVHSLSALLGIPTDMILKVVNIQETITFMTGMLSAGPPASLPNENTKENENHEQ